MGRDPQIVSSPHRPLPLILTVTLIALFLLLLLLTDCSGGGQEGILAKERLPAQTGESPPSRIISLAPSTTEILFAVGAGDQVVGVTTLCDWPPEVKKLPKIGDVKVNYEKVVSLRPDLAVTVRSLNQEAVHKLEELRIPVVTVKNGSLGDLVESLRSVGRITGNSERGDGVARSLALEIHEMREKVRKIPPSSRPRVLLEIWDHPLMSVGSGTFMDELITTAGGRNLAWDLARGFQQVSEEAVLERDPEIIVLADARTTPEEIRKKPGWSRLSAVKNGRVYLMNPDLVARPGPRVILGLRRLFHWFHPSSRILKEETRKDHKGRGRTCGKAGKQESIMPDMLVRLYALPERQEESLPEGITVRKPLSAEMHLVASWVRENFSANWASEVSVSFSRTPCSAFVALQGSEIIGFACYDSAALGMFGPMGVMEKHRGKGVGEALFLRCLEEMRVKGYAYAVIGAVGPEKFYENVAGATLIPGSEEGIFKGLLH